MAFPQELANTLDVDAGQAGWDGTLLNNFDLIAALMKTYALSVAVQGDISNPSRVEIQLQNSRGEDVVREGFLRVRVCDVDAYAEATNATIAAAGGTTVVETVSAGKDLVLKSDANGLFEIDLTDATAETVTLRIGPPPLSAELGAFRNTLDVTHA